MSDNFKIGIEIEKKYIIEKPDVAALCGMDGYFASEILQIYLQGDEGVTHRIRRRRAGDVVTYTETKKIRIDKMSSTEIEGEITEPRFLELSLTQKAGTRPINKIRHAFFYLGQLFEIDIYPEWENTAIMETELADRDVVVAFPECIRILRDVTGDKSYSNAALSHSFPKEDAII